MRKFITVLLTAALCIGCAAGCSEKDAGGDSTTVVKVWTNDSGGKVVWDALVDEYNRTTGKEKGIKIEWTTYASDYETIVDVARQNDQLPEIFAQFGSRLAEYAVSGDIIPVEEVTGGKEFLDEYQSPTIEGMNMQNGEVYALYARSNTIFLWVQHFFLNLLSLIILFVCGTYQIFRVIPGTAYGIQLCALQPLC